MQNKPGSVLINSKEVVETNDNLQQGYQWIPLTEGGYMFINRKHGTEVTILEL